jgi:hypothetical protein
VNLTPELLLSKTSDGLSQAVSSVRRFDLAVIYFDDVTIKPAI